MVGGATAGSEENFDGFLTISREKMTFLDDLAVCFILLLAFFAGRRRWQVLLAFCRIVAHGRTFSVLVRDRPTFSVPSHYGSGGPEE